MVCLEYRSKEQNQSSGATPNTACRLSTPGHPGSPDSGLEADYPLLRGGGPCFQTHYYDQFSDGEDQNEDDKGDAARGGEEMGEGEGTGALCDLCPRLGRWHLLTAPEHAPAWRSPEHDGEPAPGQS